MKLGKYQAWSTQKMNLKPKMTNAKSKEQSTLDTTWGKKAVHTLNHNPKGKWT
jgi:hypothetical protein